MNRLPIVLFALLVAAGCGDCGTDPPANNGQSNGDTNNGAECQPGERTCQDSQTLATCARSADDTPRLVTTTCLDTEECRDGDCVELPRDCDDTCTPPDTQCTPEGDVEQCADHDGDRCNEFGGAQSCEAGSYCDPDQGLCKETTCTDQCSEGETSCEDDLITTCAENAQGCLDWGPAKECPQNQSCQAGECVDDATCTDECTDGESACTGDGQIRTCVTDDDADPCTEFAPAQDCPNGGDICRQGECVPENSCQDQCLDGEQVCIGNDIATCETNTDGCLEFSPPEACPGANESCQNMGGNVSCETVMMSGAVVINEIFYDAVGDDVRGADGSPTFIELYGPPGLSIADYTIELVNGSGGATYGTFQLPADAKLDGNGYAVITTDVPDSLLGILPLYTNSYEIMTGSTMTVDVLQNDPDNVRLLDGSGTEVDAVGYGDFSQGGDFQGEGSAAAGVISGRSVGRDADGTDTDDNSADFLSYYPTPGIPNSDLIINEIYVDQPGADGSETFVELMAPILGWEDIPLDGYVLHAINGNDGEDYIDTGAIPGIDMEGWNLFDGNGTDGYVVVCNIDTAGASLIDLCTVPYEGVDYQNGPDNFVLEFNGRVVDAIGYGDFSGGETFVGEGTAVSFSSSNAGKSLARWPISDVSRELDTDDNSADFFLVDPTPGSVNPLP